METSVIEVMGHNIKLNEVIEPRRIVGGANSIEKALLCNGLLKNIDDYINEHNNIFKILLDSGRIVLLAITDKVPTDKIVNINIFTDKEITISKSEVKIILNISKVFLMVDDTNIVKVKLRSINDYGKIPNISFSDKAKSVAFGNYNPKLYEVWNRDFSDLNDEEFENAIEEFEKTYSNLTLIEFIKGKVYAFVLKGKFLKRKVKLILTVVDFRIELVNNDNSIYFYDGVKMQISYDIEKLKRKVVDVYKREEPIIDLILVDTVNDNDRLKLRLHKLLDDSTDDKSYYIITKYGKKLKLVKHYTENSHTANVNTISNETLGDIMEIFEVKKIAKEKNYLE